MVGQILLDHPLSYALTATANFPVDTPKNPFIAQVNIETIEVFMNKVCYQGVVEKKTIRQQKVVEGHKDDDDCKNRLEPESHKDSLKHVDDDDDKNDEKVDEEEIGALRMMCRRQGYMIQNMEWKEDNIHSYHIDHQEDNAPPEGEKRVKRHKASKSLKSIKGSLSKHSAKDSITYNEGYIE
nr:hypothetical protein [Tanacetum cinerariifolium]